MQEFCGKKDGRFFTDKIKYQVKYLTPGETIKIDLLGQSIAKARMTLNYIFGTGMLSTKVVDGELWVTLLD